MMILMVFILSMCIEQTVYVISIIKGLQVAGHYGAITTEMCFGALLTAALTPTGNWLLSMIAPLLGLPKRRKYRVGA